MITLSYTQDGDTYDQALAIVVRTEYDEIAKLECRVIYHIYKSQAHFDRGAACLWNGEFQAPYNASDSEIDALMLTKIQEGQNV